MIFLYRPWTILGGSLFWASVGLLTIEWAIRGAPHFWSTFAVGFAILTLSVFGAVTSIRWIAASVLAFFHGPR